MQLFKYLSNNIHIATICYLKYTFIAFFMYINYALNVSE